MKREIDCKIIQDLLPLYVDGLTSDSSNQAVKEHLEECRECRSILEKLETPIGEPDGAEVKELDFLKTLRKKNKRIIRAAAILLGVILAAVLAAAVRIFVVGMPVSPESITYECSYDEEKGELTVHGVINLHMTEFSGLTVKEDPAYAGVMNLEVRGADRFSYDKKYRTEFTGTVKIPDDGNNWRVDLVGPSYQRITVWDSFRFEDLPETDKQEYLEGEVHVTSEEVRKIKPGMTAGEIQELLGTTAACYEGGSLDYSLGYIVDEEYLIEIIFSTLNEEQPCGMTGDEILASKVPKGESRFGQ
ncbi:zf-HC2 domain-containing protein [uncultured Clostridium sp.]|uniref:zf-HC2 domain-containing protein n=1 Tax=uncultured Clostridium sp. TaxID=59620 RepID=UPI0025E043C6|nr:zf-HC2 domain-containing protein [uncultured Clostridium sp.]